MSLSTEQYQQLMRFLDVDMSEEEMQDFDKQMNENAELREQLKFELLVRENFMLQENATIETTTEKEQAIVRKFSPHKKFITWLAAAAVITAVVLSIGLFFREKNPAQLPVAKKDRGRLTEKKDSLVTNSMQNSNSNVTAINTDSLFQKYFSKEPVPDEIPIYLAQALEDYNRGDYKTLEQLSLNDVPETRSANDENEKILLLGNFYKGVAALEQHKTNLADKHFVWIINNAKTKEWKEKGHWYLALAALQSGHVEDAKKEFKHIDNSHTYGNKVKKLLEIISSNHE